MFHNTTKLVSQASLTTSFFMFRYEKASVTICLADLIIVLQSNAFLKTVISRQALLTNSGSCRHYYLYITKQAT